MEGQTTQWSTEKSQTTILLCIVLYLIVYYVCI